MKLPKPLSYEEPIVCDREYHIALGVLTALSLLVVVLGFVVWS